MSSKKHFKDLDIVRILACIGVLLYHLNILKGGYLAVCIFFVLTGYLSFVSSFKKEKFSFPKYYLNKLLKLYLPLLVVVLITVGVTKLIPDLNWFNLKPETNSVLLGYNNFWQLNANLDYFARHIDSPFMHFWYIGILLQFDLIFPFIYLIFKKLGDKLHKLVPCILSALLTIGATVYFYISSLGSNIMTTYYSTFTRVFSILFGLTLGIIHSYYKPIVPKPFKDKIFSKVLFYMYIAFLIAMFFCIDATSPLFASSMIITCIITCRLIDYGTLFSSSKLKVKDKILKFFAEMSYEIYLVQYPVIFFLQSLDISKGLYITLVIIGVLIISTILYLFRKPKKLKWFKFILHPIIYIICGFGLYQYIIAEDHTEEMKQLEQQLALNQKIIKQKEEEYAQKLEAENKAFEALMKDMENGEAELANVVTNLSIVGIGDSVMLGAVGDLYQKFPNSYYDAAVSRTAWVAGGIIDNLKSRNLLGETVIFNLGANGDCSENCKINIMNKLGNRKVFWINVTNDKDVHVNADLNALALKFENLHIIDWETISKGHREYFLADGIHLTQTGRQVYTDTIYQAIYNVYLEEYRNKRDEMIKDHENKLKNKFTFYGNNLLLNIFNDLQTNFQDAKFSINEKYSYITLKEELETAIQNDLLTNKIVLAFDKSAKITKDDYNKIIELSADRQIYIIALAEEIKNIELPNVRIIDFSTEIQNNDDYLMVDNIHLTEKGNAALKEMIKSELTK